MGTGTGCMGEWSDFFLPFAQCGEINSPTRTVSSGMGGGAPSLPGGDFWRCGAFNSSTL